MDAPKLPLCNVCGWFERIERGAYRLTTQGEEAAALAIEPSGTTTHS
jgi:hypothetical protein